MNFSSRLIIEWVKKINELPNYSEKMKNYFGVNKKILVFYFHIILFQFCQRIFIKKKVKAKKIF